MAIFIILYRPGPAWVAGKPVTEQPPAEHGHYLLQLYAAGKLRYAGPFEDDTGAAVVLEVADEHAAVAIACGDPAVQAQVFAYEIHPWQLVPWEHYLK